MSKQRQYMVAPWGVGWTVETKRGVRVGSLHYTRMAAERELKRISDRQRKSRKAAEVSHGSDTQP